MYIYIYTLSVRSNPHNVVQAFAELTIPQRFLAWLTKCFLAYVSEACPLRFLNVS